MPSWVGYLVAAAFAELFLPLAPVGTALIDAAVVVLALSQFGWAQQSPLAIGDPGTRLLPAVALIPLIRLLSLTMPVPELDPILWVALAGLPLIFAAGTTARLAHMGLSELALARPPRDLLSLIVIAASFPIGIVVGAVHPADLAAPTDSPLASGVQAAILVAGAAIPEELVFRAVLQPLLIGAIGWAGILVTAGVFGLTYVGSLSWPLVALMTGLGLLYGWEVWRSRSVWAPLIGHSAMLLTATFAAPIVLGAR